MIFINVFASLLVLQKLLLTIFYVFIDNGDQHPVSHVVSKTFDSHRFNHPKELQLVIYLRKNPPEWDKCYQIKNEFVL